MDYEEDCGKMLVKCFFFAEIHGLSLSLFLRFLYGLCQFVLSYFKRKHKYNFQTNISQDAQAQLRQEKIHFLSTFSIGQGDFVRNQVSGSCVALELPKGDSFQEYKIRLGEIWETTLSGDHQRD